MIHFSWEIYKIRGFLFFIFFKKEIRKVTNEKKITDLKVFLRIFRQFTYSNIERKSDHNIIV